MTGSDMGLCLIFTIIAVLAITDVAARCRVDGVIFQQGQYIWGPRCKDIYLCLFGNPRQTRITSLPGCPQHSHCNREFRRCDCDEGTRATRYRNNLITVCTPTVNNTRTLSTTTQEPVTSTPPPPTITTPTTVITTVTTPEPTNPVSGTTLQCPDQTWTLASEDRCIKAYSSNAQRKTYDDALAECRVHNAELFMVSSHEQYKEIKGLLMRRHRYWIGVRDMDANGPRTFQYINGQMLTSYTPWAIKQPDNHGGKEFCIEIIANRRGRWNDKRCKRRNRFICEKRNGGGASK